jgi:hypothetical protein
MVVFKFWTEKGAEWESKPPSNSAIGRYVYGRTDYVCR